MSSPIFYSSSGFYKTPVTKCLLSGVLFTSCALHVPLFAPYRQLVICNLADVAHKHKFWRFLLAKLAFSDVKDLICCSLLFYYFRVFERRMGSHKFSSYLLSTFLLSSLIEAGIIWFLHSFDIFKLETLASGPFGLVFPLFVSYFLDIPLVSRSRILGVPFSGKSLAYLLGLQTMISSSGTVICCAAGILSGIFCRNNFLKICDFVKIPKTIAKVATRFFSWTDSKPPFEGTINIGATLDIQRQQHFEMMEQVAMPRFTTANLRGDDVLFQNLNDLNRQNFNATESSNVNSMNEEQIQTLVEMGFQRQNVIRALQRSNNDANLATTILLNEG